MLVEQALRAYLLTVVPVTAIIGQRLYPGKLPQGTQLPAAVYLSVAAERPGSLLGSSGLCRHQMQLDSLSLDYGQVKALAEQFRLALEGYRGTWPGGFAVQAVTAFTDRDGDYEDETTVSRTIQQFDVWHAEPRAKQIIVS